MYDGDGKHLQKTENSTTTTYMYSGVNPMYEENSTGSACYIYGPTGLIAKRTTIDQETNTYYYHKDHLGSTRLVTNSSKDIIATSTYHPFGETEVEEGSEKYLYNGKEKDSTGLYYYGARYYDPQIGRFTSRDPLSNGSTSGSNRYAYCQNNPLRFIDPTGLSLTTFHCAYVILPDGTISYELAELYNQLQNALGELDEEDWDEINAYLESNDLSVKMEAVKMILDAAGIEYEECKDNLLMITVNDLVVGIMWEDLGENYGDFTPTITKKGTLIGGLLKLNPHKLKRGGDLFMTLRHELVHAYHQLYHWDTMKTKATSTVARTFTEYIAYTWSMIFVKNVPHVSQSHVNDIIINYYHYKQKWMTRGEWVC